MSDEQVIPDVSKYSDVDAQTDASALVALMDRMRTWPLMPEQKRRSIEELRLVAGESALDIGCGTGDEVVAMAEIVGKSGQAVGVDLSESMLGEARTRTEGLLLNTDFRKADIHKLPFESHVFDAVRAERVFEHLETPREALAEMLRVTKPGGRIVAVSPDVDCHAYDLPDREVTRKLVHFHCDERTNGWAGRQLYRLFAQAGISDLACCCFTHIFTSLPPRAQDFRKTIVQRALEHGAITEREAEVAKSFIDGGDEHGVTFTAMPHFLVAGTPP